MRLFAELCRDQNQILAVLQAAAAQVEFHFPHLARCGNDQRAIDARLAKQLLGLRVLPAPVVHHRISVQPPLKLDLMTFEKLPLVFHRTKFDG